VIEHGGRNLQVELLQRGHGYPSGSRDGTGDQEQGPAGSAAIPIRPGPAPPPAPPRPDAALAPSGGGNGASGRRWDGSPRRTGQAGRDGRRPGRRCDPGPVGPPPAGCGAGAVRGWQRGIGQALGWFPGAGRIKSE
jgi:hypothetical protein